MRKMRRVFFPFVKEEMRKNVGKRRRMSTHFKIQWAAVMTHSRSIKTPPHQWPTFPAWGWVNRRETCHGHSPGMDEFPPTILSVRGESLLYMLYPQSPAVWMYVRFVWFCFIPVVCLFSKCYRCHLFVFRKLDFVVTPLFWTVVFQWYTADPDCPTLVCFVLFRCSRLFRCLGTREVIKCMFVCSY